MTRPTSAENEQLRFDANNWRVLVTFCVEHLGWKRDEVTPERIVEALMDDWHVRQARLWPDERPSYDIETLIDED